MLSPVKAITAGALALALSAAFLVAQPVDRSDVAPGAEQDAKLAAPFEVTATFTDMYCYDVPAVVDGPLSREDGLTCTVYNEWNDPRLQGTETYGHNAVEYLSDDGEFSIAHYTHDIVTDVGAWRMRPQFRFASSDGLVDGPGNFGGTWILDGEGAYEGLSAVLYKGDPNILEGFIVPTELLPPAPERVPAD